jgi:hypothetical protein
MPLVNDFEHLNISSTTYEGATSDNVTWSSTGVQYEDLQTDSDYSLTTVVDELSDDDFDEDDALDIVEKLEMSCV